MDDINTLLDELSSFQAKKPLSQNLSNEKPEALTEDNLNDYILKKASSLIDMSLESVAELKPYVAQACNPDEIAALAELINSTAKALETINKLNLQKHKLQDDIKLKQMEHNFKREMNSITDSSSTVNNNVYIATREEIFKKFISTSENEIIIDGTVNGAEERPNTDS
jgi:hypothetical protein